MPKRDIKLWKRKKNLERKFRKGKIIKCSEDDIVDLNIGGTQLITTTKNTLCKYPKSALALLFSGIHSIKNIKEDIL